MTNFFSENKIFIIVVAVTLFLLLEACIYSAGAAAPQPLKLK
jgi:hypothetical protein